jgi:hypothetical protein
MSARTRLFLAAAILFGAVLVGGMADRVIVGIPAWQRLGAAAWAGFSRHADLGTGLIAYPIEGIGTAALSVAAALNHRFDRSANRQGGLWLYISAAAYLAGLILTLKAAPIMLGLADPQSAGSAEKAFAEFSFWGLYLRGGIDAVGLAAGILALALSPGRR